MLFRMRLSSGKSPQRAISWLLTLALALVTFCSTLAEASESKEKYVSAMVYAKWSETPLLLEAAEFIHKNNPSGFWLFAKDITESAKFDSIESSKQIE